jgi:hypothetical protein
MIIYLGEMFSDTRPRELEEAVPEGGGWSVGETD